MRYALIREMDISNGNELGMSLFVQGCHFHCPGCFNQETWDFDGGKEWTPDIENTFLSLIGRPFIKRVSFLGGEPLADENVNTIYRIIRKIKELYPTKKIWIYTGYTIDKALTGNWESALVRGAVIGMVDVIVDGQFQLQKQDINNKKVKWAGSTNQRVIDIRSTLEEGAVVFWKL